MTVLSWSFWSIRHWAACSRPGYRLSPVHHHGNRLGSRFSIVATHLSWISLVDGVQDRIGTVHSIRWSAPKWA